MSPTLMSDIQNGNLQVFSSKYQAKYFCLFKQHGRAESREVYGIRSYYILMNETARLKLWFIMSFKTALFLFSRLFKGKALINLYVLINFMNEKLLFTSSSKVLLV